MARVNIFQHFFPKNYSSFPFCIDIVNRFREKCRILLKIIGVKLAYTQIYTYDIPVYYFYICVCICIVKIAGYKTWRSKIKYFFGKSVIHLIYAYGLYANSYICIIEREWAAIKCLEQKRRNTAKMASAFLFRFVVVVVAANACTHTQSHTHTWAHTSARIHRQIFTDKIQIHDISWLYTCVHVFFHFKASILLVSAFDLWHTHKFTHTHSFSTHYLKRN